MVSTFLKRFPSQKELIALLSVSAFLVYGRMFFVFAWKLPSWMFALTVNEILSSLAYSLSFSLIESLGFTALLAGVCFLLPSRWFRDGFTPRAVWVMLTWMLSWSLFFYLTGALKDHGIGMVAYVYTWLVATILLTGLAAFASVRFKALTQAGVWLADRTLIFLFLLIPASLIGLIVVIIRNLS